MVLPSEATKVPSEPEAHKSGRKNIAAACDPTHTATEPRIVSDFGIVVDVGQEESHDAKGRNSRSVPVLHFSCVYVFVFHVSRFFYLLALCLVIVTDRLNTPEFTV